LQKEVRGLDDLINSIQEITLKLLHSPAWKVLCALALACLQALFGSYRPTILGIVILYLADWSLGLGFAIRQREVASNRLLRGAVKAVIYGNLLIVGAQVGRAGMLGVTLLGLIDSYILLTEGVSVLEKLDKWAHYYRIELPFLHRLIKYLRQQRDRSPEELVGDTTSQGGAAS
jgi:hypothetical protein